MGDQSTETTKYEYWNPKIISLLQRIGKNTTGYRWMHDKAAQYNHIMSIRYKISEVILMTLIELITGGELCALIFNNGLNTNKTIMIAITCVQLVLMTFHGIIVGIHTASDYDKNIIQHDHVATKFSELNLNIQNQLSLHVNDRSNDKEFLNTTIKTFTDLLLIAPKINRHIQNEYVTRYNDDDVFSPISYENNNDEIQIELETSSNYQIDRWVNT